MSDEQSNKPTKGTWGKLGEKDENRITFDINVSHRVTFLNDTPEEVDSTESEGNVYYKFAVTENSTVKYFDSSAWTLLSALKSLSPLKGKTVTITKKLTKGKQAFEVVEIS